MAQGIRSRWSALVAVVVVLGWASDVGARSVHTGSRQYIVGGTAGWDVPFPGEKGNYLEAWAMRVTVAEGDTLVFTYNPLHAHNVLKVSEVDYETCNASSPLLTSASGADEITVTAGSNFFICGNLAHCRSGQKVAVRNEAHKLAQQLALQQAFHRQRQLALQKAFHRRRQLALQKAYHRRRQLAVLAAAPEPPLRWTPGNDDPPSSSSSTVGAVVGGVVGGIGGVAIIAVVAFLLMKRHRNNNAVTVTGGAKANTDKMAFEGPRAVAGNAGDGEKRHVVSSGGTRADAVDKRPAAPQGTRMAEVDKQPVHHV